VRKFLSRADREFVSFGDRIMGLPISRLGGLTKLENTAGFSPRNEAISSRAFLSRVGVWTWTHRVWTGSDRQNVSA